MESERQYTKRIQTLSDAIYTCDEAGYIKLCNKAAVELWGREPVVGKDLYCGSWRIVDADGTDLPLESYPMAITLKENRAVDGAAITIQRPDGSFRNVLQYSSPIFTMHGRFAGAINMLVDVTGLNEEADAR
jgi:PAS domain S-box-containing protein